MLLKRSSVHHARRALAIELLPQAAVVIRSLLSLHISNTLELCNVLEPTLDQKDRVVVVVLLGGCEELFSLLVVLIGGNWQLQALLVGLDLAAGLSEQAASVVCRCCARSGLWGLRHWFPLQAFVHLGSEQAVDFAVYFESVFGSLHLLVRVSANWVHPLQVIIEQGILPLDPVFNQLLELLELDFHNDVVDFLVATHSRRMAHICRDLRSLGLIRRQKVLFGRRTLLSFVEKRPQEVETKR